MKRKIFVKTLCMVSIMSTLMTFPTFADEWKQDENGWKYEKNSGKYIINDWFVDPETESTYHFDTFGYMDIGEKYIDGKWYYFDENDGHLVFNYKRSDDFICTNDGELISASTSGFTAGVFSGYTNEKNAIGFIVDNMRNTSVDIGSICQIVDDDYSLKFYLYDPDQKGFVDKMTVAPKETKALMFISPDTTSVNFKDGETTVKYDLVTEGKSYWIKMAVYDINAFEKQVYIEHIE